MTPSERLDAIERRLEEATPSRWMAVFHVQDGVKHVFTGPGQDLKRVINGVGAREADLQFIVNARNWDIAWLVRVARAALGMKAAVGDATVGIAGDDYLDALDAALRDENGKETSQ
jgi:hypothetical protein